MNIGGSTMYVARLCHRQTTPNLEGFTLKIWAKSSQNSYLFSLDPIVIENTTNKVERDYYLPNLIKSKQLEERSRLSYYLFLFRASVFVFCLQTKKNFGDLRLVFMKKKFIAISRFIANYDLEQLFSDKQCSLLTLAYLF
jgi:hypothetical protein